MGSIKLSRLVHSIIPGYSSVAEINIIDNTLDEGVETAKESIRSREVDVFISAGSYGVYLRDKFPLPVMLVNVTPYDIFSSLLKARLLSDKIGVITYHTNISEQELDDIRKLLQLNFEYKSYINSEDAKDQLRKLIADGFKVIVGSTLVCDLAEKAGLAEICVYSPNSIRQAIDNAIQFSRTIQNTRTLRDQFNSILEHLNEGLIAVDSEERIQFINPAAQGLLSIPAERSLGSPLSDILPQLSLKQTLKTGGKELGKILRIGSRTILTNRAPVKAHGIQTGAVLLFQDSASIQQAGRVIRSKHNPLKNNTARYHLGQVIGTSKTILQAKLLASHYAKTDSTILITGETGTGKELFAQSIHNSSNRKTRPFVAINCAAFPETLLESELFGYEEGAFTGTRRGGKAGLFESAHTGTVFLDEVGSLPIALQTRFLRFLQEKEVLRLGSVDSFNVDVRVIAATNCELRKNIAEGKFREDLYYRLNILHLQLPPLRERREDIPAIAAHLLTKAVKHLGSDRPADTLLSIALPYLIEYPWPGNVREMENIIERLAVFYINMDKIDLTDHEHINNIIPELIAGPKANHQLVTNAHSLKKQRNESELAHIHRVIFECGYNLSDASKHLEISRSTLWRKLNRK